MHHRPVVGAALAALAVMLAGCAGTFDVRQTEPLRIQLEGAPQTVLVKEGDTAPAAVLVENTSDAEAIDVTVEVERTSTGPVTVVVTVQDADTNQTIVTRTVTVGETSTSATNPTATATATTTGTSAQTGDSTVVQNIFIDVKGKDNIIVLTEAQDGSANVSISANEATGNGSIESGATTSSSSTYP